MLRVLAIVAVLGFLAAAGAAQAALNQPQIEFLPAQVVPTADGLTFLVDVRVTKQTALDATAVVELDGPLTLASDDWAAADGEAWTLALGALEKDTVTTIAVPTRFTGDGAGEPVRMHLTLSYLRAGTTAVYEAAQYTYDYTVPAPPPGPFVPAWALAAAPLVAAPLGAVVLFRYRQGRAEVEEVFVMHDSGIVIARYGRREPERDSDILGGMFLVMQEFVRDSFLDRSSDLEELKFGDRRLVMVRGDRILLAAVVRGERMNGLHRRLREAVMEFEQTYRPQLDRWRGRIDEFGGADRIMSRLLPA